MIKLSVQNLSVMRDLRPILQDISFTAQGGEFIGLIGPNGAGKTSLMRAILGLLPHQGSCNLSALSPQAKAKHVSWLPQSRDVAWPLSVEKLVMLGRQPHDANAEADEKAVRHAIDAMELSELALRPATELSGGETARALIARCLAQETDIFMADEPLAGLDMAYQLSTLELLSDRAKQGKLIITSVHDIGLAARYCTRFILLGHQQILADGKPDAIMKDTSFSEVFGIESLFAVTEDGPIFMPRKRLA